MNGNMIELKNVSKTYKSKTVSVEALKNINLNLPNTGMVFIVGKSGCGKTTLLNVMGGLDKFDSGEFYINGKSTVKYKDGDWDKYRNSAVGFVFQENNLLDEYSVFGNVKLATDLQKNDIDKSKIINEALKYVGLDGYGDRKISELSGGQKQRVAIARAIAKKSKILFADEPTGALDEKTGKEIFDLLKQLSKSQLVIVVTHDTDSANKYGDVLIEMSDGEIIKTTDKLEGKDIENSSFEMKRGRVKFGTSLGLALKSYKRRPIRLISLILLSMFGFSLMTGALKFAFWEPYDLQEQVIESESYAIVAMTPETKYFGGGMSQAIPRSFDKTRLKEFKSNYNNLEIAEVYSGRICEPDMMFGENLTEKLQIYYDKSIYGAICVDESKLANSKLTLLAGEYPNERWGENDIAISKYLYEMFSLMGYKRDGESVVKISSYEDLLGKKIQDYTVRGIIDTQLNNEDFLAIRDFSLGNVPDYDKDICDSFMRYISQSIHTLIFFKESKILDYSAGGITVFYDNVKFGEVNFVKSIIDSEDYHFVGSYAETLENQVKNSGNVARIMGIVALIMVAFAVFLFINFLSVSIVDKMRQIGILRALGASKGGIAFIFIVQNIIISLFVFAVACVMTKFAVLPVLITIGVETYFPFTWFVLEFWDFLLLFGIVVASGILASLLPLIKLSKKTPCEIISYSSKVN